MGLTLRLSAFWAATPHQILACQDVTFYYVVTVFLSLFPFSDFLSERFIRC